MKVRTPEVTVEDFAARRAEGVTVDVREGMEYAGGHVPEALLIPMGQLASRLGELPRGRRVHVICATGNRSKAMADLLVAAGYDAVSVTGGTQAWIATGRRIVVGP